MLNDRRHLFFSEFGDDDTLEEGFYGYVPKSDDPGIGLFFLTAAFCLLTFLTLPCMVVLGNRYEKRRLWKQRELEEEAVTAAAAAAPKEGEFVEVSLENPKEIEMSVIPGDASAATPSAMSSGRHRRKNGGRSEVSGMSGMRGRSEVGSSMTNRTNTSSFIHGRGGRREGALTRMMDRVVMPPYADDESRSIFGQAAPRSTISNTSTNLYAPSAISTATYGTNVLDARIGRRRRGHGGHMKQTAVERARRVHKHVEHERQLYPYVAPRSSGPRGRADWSDTMSDLGGVRRGTTPETVSSSPVADDATSQIYARSEMGMATTTLQNRGRNGSRRTEKRSRSKSPTHSVMSKVVDDISPNDAADADDPGQAAPYEDDGEELHIFCGKNALWRPAVLARAFDKMIEIAEPDNETKRIIKLSIPFTVAEIMEAVFESIGMALIGNFLGTAELAAYAVVEILMGTTGEFVDGLIDAEATVCTHAVGVGNNHLAGQYVQMSAILFTAAMIPVTILWWYCTAPALMWLGFDESTAQIGQDYARVACFLDYVEGWADCYHGLLEVTDHELFSTMLDIIEGLIELLSLGILLMHYQLRLTDIAWIEIGLDAVFFIFTIIFTYKKGWMRPFWAGIFESNALKNWSGVKNLVGTATPLAIGSLLGYGEWEVLTLYASHLGPAEVASWAILGTIWETFEASTEGIGDGAEIRVAYHLGKGNPNMARISAYKSILLGVIFALFITSIFFIMGDDLPTWFTTDPTLQRMLADVIPLVGLGNITMTFGMVCWALIGAQGRYRLATSIALVTSWGVTMPVGAIMVYVLNYDLKGITASVVIGYAVAGTVMSYVILRSDWERLSKIVIELNAVIGEVDSSDSEEEEESSSSSSSSASSDDDDSDDDSSDEENSRMTKSSLSKSAMSKSRMMIK